MLTECIHYRRAKNSGDEVRKPGFESQLHHILTFLSIRFLRHNNTLFDYISSSYSGHMVGLHFPTPFILDMPMRLALANKMWVQVTNVISL